MIRALGKVAAAAIGVIVIGSFALAALVFVMMVDVRGEELIEPTPQEAEDIKTWIPQTCCRTNNCCRKVVESALIQLRNNQVQVATTGQILPRTGWSQDKNTWRCTCDWNDATKQWLVHPNANTRCVFPHHSGF